MSTIGVIGAGHIGRFFSLAAIRSGYDIMIANARGPETLCDLIAELGPQAQAATTADAAEAADFVLLAIPLTGLEQVPVEPLAGKVVLATCNYFRDRDGANPELDTGALTVPGLVQAHLAGSQVARAFNHIDAAQILSGGSPVGTADRRALAYAADDEEAAGTTARVYEEFGFDAVSVGGLDAAWRLDVDQPAFVTRMNKDELRTNLVKAERHLITEGS